MKLKVLDLSRLLPGPYASQILADLGAEVLKVEDPRGGDYLRWMPPLVEDTSALFAAINRGKRSLGLDLKQPAGREVFLDLVRGGFDVVLESFRPGVMARLGLSFEALEAVNPRVILCSISGFGASGPDAARAGHDLGYLARSGVANLLGASGEAPIVPGVQIADIVGGTWPAVAGILAAALEREETGRGRALEISMTHGAAALLAPVLAGAMAGGEALARGETLLGGGVPCYGNYRCHDGRWMALCALEPKFWEAFCAVVERPALSGRGLDRGEAGLEVRRELEAVFGSRSQANWVKIFEANDCCCEPVREGIEVLDDEGLRLRDRLIAAELPGGEEVQALLTPLADAASAPRRVSALGGDTEAVLSALGYSARRVASLREACVIPPKSDTPDGA